jgi:hypothetical protein
MHNILKQCRDALISGRRLLSTSQSELGGDEIWEIDLRAWMNGHAALIKALDAELARTDGPSEEQVNAALEAYNGAPGHMTEVTAGGMRRAMKRALYVAGVRAPRVTVPDEPNHSRIHDDYVQGQESGYERCWYEFIEAIRAAGGVPVDQKGEEIK